jgi:hypothetical protein
MKWIIYFKSPNRRIIFLFVILLTFVRAGANNYVFVSPEDTTVVELFAIPGPDEILHYVSRDELKFNKLLLNNPNKTDIYMTSKERYVALGVYLADLAYCVSFKQTNSAIKYLNVIDEMGKKLNVFPSNIEDVKSRFAENIGNIDSLKALYSEVYELVMDHIFATSRYNHYTLVSAGTFVESVYLAVNSTQLATHSSGFNRRLGDQNRVAQTLMQMFVKNLDVQTQEVIVSEFKPFAEAFDAYGSKASPQSAKTRYDGTVVISPSHEALVTQKSLTQLTDELVKLRTLWTKN